MDVFNPFRAFVPKPLGVLVLLLLFWPPTFSSGSYLGNLSEMTGSMGVYSESVQMSGYLVFVGMSVFVPLMLPFLTTRRPKQVFLWGFAGLAVLNTICATADNILVLFASCLLMGVVRLMLMLNCTFTIAPYLTGFNTLEMFTVEVQPGGAVGQKQDRLRSMLMPLLYTYILSIANVCNIVMTSVAEDYSWRHAYYAEVGLLLVGMLMVDVLMRDEPGKKPFVVPARYVPDMLLLCASLTAFCFVMAYGKTLDWLHSPAIVIAASLCLVTAGLFLLLQLRRGSHAFLPLEAARYPHVWVAALLFVVLVVMNASSVMPTSFAHLATGASDMQIGSQGRWAILGSLIGLFLAVGLVLVRCPFRLIFMLSFLLMAASNALMYFLFQDQILLRQLALPIVLMNAGLLPLYALVAAYGMRGLPNHLLASLVFVMIFMRNAVAPPIGSALYANWLYHRQQYHMQRLAEKVEPALLSGLVEPASMRRKLTVQANLAAMKDVSGMTVWVLLGIDALLIVLPKKLF